MFDVCHRRRLHDNFERIIRIGTQKWEDGHVDGGFIFYLFSYFPYLLW